MNLQIDLRPTVLRLRGMVPSLKLVGGAAEYQAALQQVPALPAAFVMAARSRGSQNEFGSQIVEQTISSEFAVILAVQNLSDTAGAAALASLKPVRDAVCAALLNWQPDEDAFGCEYGAGELFAFSNGVLWWSDTYRTSHVIRSQ